MSQPQVRYGFRLKCNQCGYSVTLGGYPDAVSRDTIETAYKTIHNTRQPTHTFTSTKDFHAAELAHVFIEQPDRQTTTSTSFVDVPNMVVSNTSLTAGKKYLIFATAQQDSSSAAVGSEARMIHGSTAWDDSVANLETNVTGSAHKTLYAWWTVWTAITGEDVKMQYRGDAAGTQGIDQVTINVIKLSDDLVENTDWYHNEVTAATSLVTSGASSTNNASVTFTTPASPASSQKWLVFTKSRITNTNAAASTFSRMFNSIGGVTNATPLAGLEGEDATNDKMVYTLMRPFTIDGGVSCIFREEAYAAGTNNGVRQHSGVFALNLEKLQNASVYNSGSSSTVTNMSATAYATQVGTVSITPTVTGDVWSMGFLLVTVGAAGIWFKARLQVDNVDQPDTQTTDNYQMMDSWESTDGPTIIIQSVDNLSSGSAHTVDLDGSVETAASGRGYRNSSVFAATMELAATGQTLVKPVSETVGITEETIRARGLNRPVSETVGITEETGRYRARSPQAPETIGVGEETVRSRGMVRPISETVGLGEETGYILGKVRVIEETVGIAEQIQRIVGKIRTTSESISINEEVIRTRSLTRIIDETIGITEETVRARAIAKIIQESLGITEDVLRIRGRVQTVSESMAIIEPTANRGRDLARIIGRSSGGFPKSGFTASGFPVDDGRSYPGEGIDINEEVIKTISRNIIKIVEEPVGITEEINRIRGRIQSVDESLSIGEATVLARAIVRIVDEQLSVNEQIERLRGRIVVIDEAVTVSEELLRARALVQVVDETLGLAEALNEGIARTRLIDETMTVDEVVSHILNKTRVVDETLNVNEIVNAVLTPVGRELVKVVDETITISEDATRVTGLIRLVEENMDIAESLVKVANLVRVVSETVTIDEATTRLRNLVRLINETESIQESAISIRAITKIVDEVIDLSENASSTIGKVAIIDEGLQILESIVEKLTVYVPPPTAPLEQRVGGVLKRRPRQFRLRKGARIVHLGPRYYLPPPTPKQRSELLRRIEQRKLKQELSPRYIVSVECKAVYSKAAPAPSITDILNKLELGAILQRAQLAEQEIAEKDTDNKTIDYTEYSYLPKRPQEQPIEKSIPIKTITRAGVIAKYDKFAFVKTETIAKYDKRQTVTSESPKITYDKFKITRAETTASYSKKKPIPKNFENQVKTIEQLYNIIALDAAMEQV